MKGTLYSVSGEKKTEVNLPKIFDIKIREDLPLKYFLMHRFVTRQPYSPDPRAGRKHVASGRISHRRHEWAGHYGKGVSRIPRKTMWRRGTQFYWVGAEVNMARGGRRVHAPVTVRTPRKLNKKEVTMAMNIAFASTGNKDIIMKRYSSLANTKLSLPAPIVIESQLDNIKSKDLLNALEKIFGSLFERIIKNKEVRSGKGKGRGRKYKTNAPVLLIKGEEEKIKNSEIDVLSVKETEITDLYPLGRLVVYTEKALKEIEKMGERK